MKKFIAFVSALALGSSLALALQHTFNSQKITFDQLPQPAKNAIKAQAGNAAIQDVNMETFDGFTTYQVSFNKGGTAHDLRVDSQGRTWGNKWKEIPAAVERAAENKIGTGQLLGFRKQAASNGQQLYHFRYQQNGAPADLWLSAAGTPVQAPAGADIIETAGANAVTAGQTVTLPQAAGAGPWIQFKDLPWPVQQSVMKESGGASVQRVYKTQREGTTVYHARFMKEGHDTHVAVREDGTVLTTTTGLPTTEPGVGETGDAGIANTTTPLSGGVKVNFQDLPQAAQNSITAQAQGAAIEDIDKGTINGQTVYEAAFKRGGRTYELQVKEDGTILGGHFD